MVPTSTFCRIRLAIQRELIFLLQVSSAHGEAAHIGSLAAFDGVGGRYFSNSVHQIRYHDSSEAFSTNRVLECTSLERLTFNAT